MFYFCRMYQRWQSCLLDRHFVSTLRDGLIEEILSQFTALFPFFLFTGFLFKLCLVFGINVENSIKGSSQQRFKEYIQVFFRKIAIFLCVCFCVVVELPPVHLDYTFLWVPWDSFKDLICIRFLWIERVFSLV